MQSSTPPATYFIHVPLDCTGREAIDEIRMRFDPAHSQIEPHLTLVFPFLWGDAETRLLSHVRDVAAATSPFDIELSDFSGSEDEYLFLNVKRGNDLVISLHDRLYDGLLARSLDRSRTYVPHVTVGRLADRAGMIAALESIGRPRLFLNQQVTRICVERDLSASLPAQRFSIPLGH